MFIKRLKSTAQPASSDLRLRLMTAKTTFARFRGLMLRRSMPPDCALLITPCNWIHSMFMLFSIDAVFLNKEMEVVAIKHLNPFNLSMPVKKAQCVLEMKAGLSAQCNILAGDRFIIDG